MTAIDPDALYSVSAAAALIPSNRRGRQSISEDTLRKWIRARAIPAVRQARGSLRPAWFIRGAVIEQLREGEPVPAAEPLPRTGRQRSRAVREAEEYLDKMGVK